MTHEGRMTRGKENHEKGLLDNADTIYYLANKDAVEAPKEEKKSKIKRDKKW